MPTRKQRRRRAKEHRHEYVWEDGEGNVLESNEPSTTKSESRSGPTRSRSGKVVQPPSWRRSLKRGGIFAPIMFATVLLLSPKLAMSAKVAQTLFIVVVFVPFSYVLDGILYRSHLKRSAQRDRANGRRGS
jgi:hypothetical protein